MGSISAAAGDASTWITLVVGVVAAAVALVGYWSNQYIKRRDVKIQMYAEALQAIHAYEELLYAIRYRRGSDSEVRSALAEKMSDVFAKINYHQTLLDMDSPMVGTAYEHLFARTRQHGGPFRREAWNTQLVMSDEEMPGGAYYPYDNKVEMDACLTAMRRELVPWGWALRGGTRRRLEILRDERPSWQEPERMRQRREQVLREHG
ncbi:hypothetical protein [Streptomyces sp. NPDC002553]|uniref:hypothetical protein n=1 Tax=Streptomyces sp. NPDC002553 TaxID=3154417 RepID=UPI0033219F2C